MLREDLNFATLDAVVTLDAVETFDVVATLYAVATLDAVAILICGFCWQSTVTVEVA